MRDRLPPRIASELHDRLLAIDPRLRELSNLDEVPISGDDLFALLGVAWLCGYGTACGDLADLVPDGAPMPERVEMILAEAARPDGSASSAG